MCIVTLNRLEHPKYKLIIVANRDEAYARPTKEAHFWHDNPNILAGRDLEEMGTWLGITKQGKFAALTNVRDATALANQKDFTTRGEIVANFLKSNVSPTDFLKNLREESEQYNGFNVLVGDANELFYYGNRQSDIIQLTAGTHSLSNHLLNTPWPKVELAKEQLSNYISQYDELNEDDLFAQLTNDTKAPDELLPETGVGFELERELSPIFIRTPEYGTRSSTVILMDHNHQITYTERTYQRGNLQLEQRFSFTNSENSL